MQPMILPRCLKNWKFFRHDFESVTLVKVYLVTMETKSFTCRYFKKANISLPFADQIAEISYLVL